MPRTISPVEMAQSSSRSREGGAYQPLFVVLLIAESGCRFWIEFKPEEWEFGMLTVQGVVPSAIGRGVKSLGPASTDAGILKQRVSGGHRISHPIAILQGLQKALLTETTSVVDTERYPTFVKDLDSLPSLLQTLWIICNSSLSYLYTFCLIERRISARFTFRNSFEVRRYWWCPIALQWTYCDFFGANRFSWRNFQSSLISQSWMGIHRS